MRVPSLRGNGGVAVLAVVLQACTLGVRPTRSQEPQARLVFHVNGLPLHVGVVEARVGGVATLALIDTGAGRHVISTALARRVGHPVVDSSDTTLDPAGRVLTIRTIEDVPIELVGLGVLPDQPPIVLDLPSVFEEMGIGLILSPQRAVEEGQALSIDYRTGAVTRVVDRVVSTGQPASMVRSDQWPNADACGGSDASGPLFVFPGKIDGESVSLTLDTGADSTCVFGASPIARVLRERYVTTPDQALGAGGAIMMRRTPNILVHVGAIATMRALPILPREGHGICGQDGHLGLDVLHSCVVTISREHASVNCPS